MPCRLPSRVAITRILLASAACGGLFACTEPTGPTGPAWAAPAASTGPVGSSSAAATGSAVDETAVRALVASWVEAQNKGDFAAYQKLYAAKVEGIKRSGQRTWRFDKKGWLDDRGRMFKKPMTVEAHDVSVRLSAASALVELRQRFKQDKFEDEGLKRMVVALENGELRIAREEMVHSVLASGKTEVAQPFR